MSPAPTGPNTAGRSAFLGSGRKLEVPEVPGRIGSWGLVIRAAMAAVVCAIATLGHVAEAARFRSYVFIRTNSGYTSGGIGIDGPIKPGDDLRFRAALNDARRHLNYVANVRLNSLGGDHARRNGNR